MSFSEIRITGGTVVRARRDAQHLRALTDVDLSLAWPSISRASPPPAAPWRGEADRYRRHASAISPPPCSGERSGAEGAARRRAVQVRLRRRDEHAADAEDRRRAVGRRAVAAPRAGLDRPEAVAGRRLRALRAQGADQCGRRHHRAVQRQSRTRRQCRRRRADLCRRRPPDPAGHARGRSTRSHALSVDASGCSPPASANGAARRSISTALPTFDLDLRLSAGKVTIGADQARPHRDRRQPARRQAWRDDRRIARLRRRDQGHRSGSRTPSTAPTSRRSCSSTDVDLEALHRRPVRRQAARRQRQSRS